MSKPPSTVVLVANLGTPCEATPEAVEVFLREFLSDPLVVDYPALLWRPLLERVILKSRPQRVAEMYRSIASNGTLPLAAGTQQVAAALGRALGEGFHVEPVYRYGSPSVAERLAQWLRGEGHAPRDVVVLPLFAQRTSSSSETIVLAADDTAREHRASHRLRVARVAPDCAHYIEALADRVRAVGSFEHLVVSFHGIPRRYDRREGGTYQRDCRATVRALVEALGIPESDVSMSFQSRFGPEPWLGPATFDTLRALGRRGVEDVAVVMPGFVTEGLETLEEIGVRGRSEFTRAGGKRLTAVPAVGAHPRFVASLVKSIRQAVGVRESA
jgi:ferrochelatase